MIKTKTLLILGAGASAPFDFPLGRKLRDRIYRMLAPLNEGLKTILDNTQFRALRADERFALFDNEQFASLEDGQLKYLLDDEQVKRFSNNELLRMLLDNVYKDEEPLKSPLNLLMNVSDHDLNCYYDRIQEFREALLKSGRFSVDAFLEHRFKKFEVVGKRAIAIALRRHENPKIFDRMIREKENNWYELLVEALIEDVPFEKFSELGGKKLAIVTFNYDRSLEYYLHESLIHNYGITSEEAAEKINEIGIIHVHGKLGDLPWQKNPKYQLPYDININPTMVGQMADNIKIIPTATIDTLEFEQARSKIEWAGRIFILGFGFNKQNLKRLQLGPLRKESGGVFGTGMGLRCRDFNTISALAIRSLAQLQRRRFTESWNFPFPDKTIYEYLWDDIDLTE